MNANRLRLAAGGLIVTLALIVVMSLMFSRCSNQDNASTTRQSRVKMSTSTPSGSASPTSSPQSTTNPPDRIAIPNQVNEERWPPSVKPTVKANIVTTKMPAEVKSQLFTFLKAYYTLQASDVRAHRAAHIESLVSKRALPLDASLSSLPMGATSTLDKIEEDHLVAQLDPNNPSQILVTVPVQETLRSQGVVAFQTIRTGTWFEYSSQDGWSIIHFIEAVAQ